MPSNCNSFTYYGIYGMRIILYKYDCEENEEKNNYNYIEVYDNNTYVTCYCDGRIIVWNDISSNNFYFISNETGISVNKVIYNSKGDLISCSSDGIIKIWFLNDNKFVKSTSILNHENEVNSILLLEDKNILISSGDGIKFWK